jgi:hypothetical protein
LRPREELKEIADKHLKGLKCELHMRFAALKGLAKAINQVATEVDADLIVFKTHGRCRFAHLVALASWWPCLADSIATTLACLVNRDTTPRSDAVG